MEIVHLSERKARVAEAENASVKSLPALVLDGAVFHRNHEAVIAVLRYTPETLSADHRPAVAAFSKGRRGFIFFASHLRHRDARPTINRLRAGRGTGSTLKA